MPRGRTRDAARATDGCWLSFWISSTTSNKCRLALAHRSCLLPLAPFDDQVTFKDTLSRVERSEKVGGHRALPGWLFASTLWAGCGHCLPARRIEG